MSNEQTFSNHLAGETSPYLLQHAHNPVDWYPWGEEAFEKARAEDKPVLVSIGYSACHWCHVMEHESFEDKATAAIMNEHFVNIKVDMEERPDIDQIYMNFVQLTTGRGGWPMNVFVRPDKKPFFGGTYFPPSPQYGMPSWKQILLSIADAWHEKRGELDESVERIVSELQALAATGPSGSVSNELLERAFASFSKSFDQKNGGFGGVPKFPQAMSLEFLLRYHHRTGDRHALEMVTRTLDKMARGGIYDQLGGGFHRYSVDTVWLVPHFEKMLYDNALLARLYLHAFQVTGKGLYKRVAVETLDYLVREMLDESGGFYSSQDADSEGEEGKFFVWTKEEIEYELGAEAERFCRVYGVSAEGNFEGKNILNLPSEESSERELSELGTARLRLFDLREKRIKPGRDEKVLTAWNGLALAAFADAGGVLGRSDYLQVAERNAEFILGRLKRDGRLLRTWKGGKAKLNGYIEDYANVADGLLALSEATGDLSKVNAAKELAEVMLTEFWDRDSGGFFFTSDDHEELIVRNKDLYDNATPSGNSAAADVMLRLAKLTGDERYDRYAVTTLRIASPQIQKYPQAFGRFLSAIEFRLAGTKEVVVIGPPANELRTAAMSLYLPNSVRIFAEASVDEIPLLSGRKMIDGKATAYVCENFVCERPVTDIDEFKSLLGR